MSKYTKESLYKVLEGISDTVLPSIIEECIHNGISINLKVDKEGTVTLKSIEESTINDKKLKRKHIITHGLGFCSEESRTKRIKE